MYLTDLVRSAFREVARVAKADTRTHGQLRDRIVAVLVVTVGVDLIFAALAWVFEHGQPTTEIKTYGGALFWTSTQLLTVSSQIRNPISVPGRILDVVMEAYAITVVATMAGSVGSFMVRRARDDERGAAADAAADAR